MPFELVILFLGIVAKAIIICRKIFMLKLFTAAVLIIAKIRNKVFSKEFREIMEILCSHLGCFRRILVTC